MVLFLKNMLQLVLSPKRGWEDVSNADADPRYLAQTCMYPLFVLAAISIYVQRAYHDDISYSDLTIKGAAIFVSFFVTYVFAVQIFRVLFNAKFDTDADDDQTNTVIVYSLSLLAITMVICNLMPMTLGLPYLLPVAVAMIIWKSDLYLNIKEDKELSFAFFMIATLILPPCLVRALFDWAIGL